MISNRAILSLLGSLAIIVAGTLLLLRTEVKSNEDFVKFEPPTEIQSLAAQQLFFANDLTKANALFKRYYPTFKHNKVFIELYSSSLLRTGQKSHAKELLLTSVQSYPFYVKNRNLLTQAFLELGDTQQAHKTLEKFPELYRIQSPNYLALKILCSPSPIEVQSLLSKLQKLPQWKQRLPESLITQAPQEKIIRQVLGEHNG